MWCVVAFIIVKGCQVGSLERGAVPEITHSPAPRARSIDQPFGSVRAHSHDPPGHLSPACCGRHCRHHARNVLSVAREAASKALGTCNRVGWEWVRYGSEIPTNEGDKRLSESESGRVIRLVRFPSTWGSCRHVRSPRPASAALASRGSTKRPAGHSMARDTDLGLTPTAIHPL